MRVGWLTGLFRKEWGMMGKDGEEEEEEEDGLGRRTRVRTREKKRRGQSGMVCSSKHMALSGCLVVLVVARGIYTASW